MPNNSKKQFTSLYIAAEAANDEVLRALDYAIDNANDTKREGGLSDDSDEAYYDIALRSICSTSPFTESADVRDWFAANGYTW